MLKIDNLFKMRQEMPVLQGINLEVKRGQIAILLGASGAGKSTLLRILNNLESYDAGSIFFDGRPLELNKTAQTHTVGMVFQQFNLFEHLNVLDNVLLALIHCKQMKKSEAEVLAQSALERYGLLSHASRSVHSLSGGQKQRLALARTLALDPKIVCLDEPTSALDPQLTSQIAELTCTLANEGRIVLVTTHDLHLIQKLEGELFFLQKGAIKERVKKKEYFTRPEIYPALHQFLGA